MSNLLSHNKIASILITIIGAAFVVAFGFFDAIPQDAAYHSFSDVDTFFGIPNALNVVSNIPFLIVGLAGLILLNVKQPKRLNIVESNWLAYFLFFLAVSLVALGSGYYHLRPTNESLLWDRIPMTIAFMALYSIVITEFVSERFGKLCLIPFVCLGIFSVLYWSYTEKMGAGDLRYYAFVQFFPLATIPVILLLFGSRFALVSAYWWLIVAYIIAKVLETFDGLIHVTLLCISGHSLKHVISSLGVCILLYSFRQRSVAK